MSFTVTIALGNTLFSEGIRKLLEDVEEIDGVDVLKTGATPRTGEEAPAPEVVLVDYATLCDTFRDTDAHRMRRFILIDTGYGDGDIMSVFVERGLKGLLNRPSSSEELEKAVKAVGKGEIWLDKLNVKSLLAGLQAGRHNDRTAQLTRREREVVRLVGEGYRNREIAGRLCISEPTVKTHVQRIFQKLGIQGRPQLITFAVRNGAAAYQKPG
jgi:DNA-binding NarL/FixJ family response regulator